MAPRPRSRPRSAWFAPATPRLLAHRGLAHDAPENTLGAFDAAVAVGAGYLETDVNASADGIAVVVHDPTLERIAARTDRVSDLTLAELRAIDLGGGARFATLAEALAAQPGIRFNIDVKSADAAAPTAAAVLAAGALDRVLITSFSRRRRRSTTRLLDAARPAATPPVAASASAAEFVPALIFAKLGLIPLVRFALRHVDAVQIPTSVYGVTTATPRTVRRLHAAGVEVHVWTINDVEVARALLGRGVDGIVSDRVDQMMVLVTPELGTTDLR